MRNFLRATLLLLLCAPIARAQGVADLVVYGRIWTGDAMHPWAEAVAVQGERIAAVGSRRPGPPAVCATPPVGSRRQVLAWVGRATRILDAGRNLVTPGFADAHTHFLAGGFQLVSV